MLELSVEYRAYIDSPAWRLKRQGALERAGRRCQVCNTSKRLDVHHRTYERFGDEASEDLTVLCRSCHELYHEKKRTVHAVRSGAKPSRSRDKSQIDALVAAVRAYGGRATVEQIASACGLSGNKVNGYLGTTYARRHLRREGKKGHRIWRLKDLPPAPSPKRSTKLDSLAQENERLHRIQQHNKERQRQVRTGVASPALKSEFVGCARR